MTDVLAAKSFAVLPPKMFELCVMNIRPYSVGLLPNREVKVIYEYSTDVLRVLCSEHMGKTNLTILAAVADRPSV